MNWINDVVAEKVMFDNDILFTVENVLITDIDVESSLQNQARLDQPLNQDMVSQYKAGMSNGSPFPR